MKKVGILTLTRQNSLAYSVLKRTVETLGYKPICGEAIGAESLFFPLEELTLVGYDFLGDFLKKVGLSEADILLISAPYSVNLFALPKVIWCLRTINPAPIVLGGNEASNNYRNIMLHRFATFAHTFIDIAPDFIVRGSAETVLPSLLPLLEKTTMTQKWDRGFLKKMLQVPSLVFWLPGRKALLSTEFSSEALAERDIFSYVQYGGKTLAITLQRSCVWAKKSHGGCLFCAIASQFGKNFHCAVQTDFFTGELSRILTHHPEIEYIDIWDDTFNIEEDWVLKVCDFLKRLNQKLGREIIYSCFLRPRGLKEKLVKKMREANIRVVFIGADALTEGLSRRLRRGCTIPELNQSIENLKRERIQPRLSVQLFSPESTLDDSGITATAALSGIKNGKSTVHVHLYTFPLFGSDIYRLLEARNNLKKIPTPLLRIDENSGFHPYGLGYDYINYDPDVEEIKQKTYRLLGIAGSFYVRTYPGDDIDGNKLKEILKEVRNWCIEGKKTHPLKSLWYMTLLFLEGKGDGLEQKGIFRFLSKGESELQVPENLRSTYGNFGYAYTLSRSFIEVMDILIKNRWVEKMDPEKYRLTSEGLRKLKSMVKEAEGNHLRIAAYGEVTKTKLLEMLNS